MAIDINKLRLLSTRLNTNIDNLNKNKIAVEHNGTIIPKSKYKKKYLKNNDSLEIVHFIGGG